MKKLLPQGPAFHVVGHATWKAKLKEYCPTSWLASQTVYGGNGEAGGQAIVCKIGSRLL